MKFTPRRSSKLIPVVRAATIALLFFLANSAKGGTIHTARWDSPPFNNLAVRMFYPGVERTFAVDSTEVARSSNQSSKEVNYGRLALVGGTLLTGMAVIHIYQQNGWWKDNRAPFHFREDLVYGVNVDKIGHFYGATLLTFVIRKAVEWSNVSEQTSLYVGASAALLFQTYVEVEDGYSAWGFDRVDFASDVAGSAWPVLQYHVPYLQNFDVKLSYHPSPLLDSPGGVGFRGQKHIVIDDYEGQTFWFSAKVNNLLPQKLESYWPDFLCLSIGYGARDVASPDRSPHRVYFIALDYDMTKIIPDNTWFLKTLGQALNFIHLPAPAIRITPSAIWYGLYF